MKKKLMALALIVILLASVLSGCTLFIVNEERDYQQTLATVTRHGVTGTITKGEYYEYFAQTAPTYMQYYGWTAKQCQEEFLAMLAKKEVILIEAKNYYSTKDTSLTKTDAAIKFLSASEQTWVTRRANKSFQDAYDDILSQLVADDKANSGDVDDEEDTDTDEDKLDPRPTKPETDDDAEYRDSMPAETVEDFFTMMDKKELTKMERKAIDKVKKNLKDQYKDFDFFLNQQSESRLMTKFQNALKKGEIQGITEIEISAEDLTNKYNLTINQQKLQFSVDAAYKTALDGEEVLIVHNNQYVKVKSILMQFTESQKAILAALKEKYKGHEDLDMIVNSYRKMMVIGGDVSDFPFIIDSKNLGLKVNISNINYKEDSACSVKNCPCIECDNYDKTTCPDKDVKNHDCAKHDCTLDMETVEIVDGCPCVACENNAYEKLNVPYEDVLKLVAADIKKAADEASNAYDTKYPTALASDKAAAMQMFTANEKLRVFEDWIYKINDDSGMFEGKSYTATPSGKASDYVVEYTSLIRAMINDGATRGQMATGATTYTIGKSKVEIYTVNDEASMPISYIINDFGVHIIMMSDVPVDTVLNTGKYTQESMTTDYINDNGDTVKDVQYTLSDDAIIKIDAITGKVVTVRETIKKTYKDAYESERYSVYERALFKDFGDEFMFDKKNLNKEINGVKITLKSSVYKEIGKLTGANKDTAK